MYANKRNLAVLSDPERLRSFGVSEDIARTLLSGIPRTEIVDASDAERLWSQRRKLFFKPAAGFGSRAAYRGAGVYTLALFLFAPVWGRASDRLGRRSVLLIGLLGFGDTMLIFSFVENLTAVYAERLLTSETS